jgi:hypothetical protein
MLLEYIYSTGVTNDDRHFVIVQVTTLCVIRIDIESQNRLLKVCYVPATSAGLSRLLFLSFFAVAINSTNEANKAGSTHL